MQVVRKIFYKKDLKCFGASGAGKEAGGKRNAISSPASKLRVALYALAATVILFAGEVYSQPPEVVLCLDGEGAYIEATAGMGDLGIAGNSPRTVEELTGEHEGRIIGEPEVVLTRPFETGIEISVEEEELTLGPMTLRNPRGEVHYQWYRDGEPLDGATQKTLTISDIGLNILGRYHVVADDDRDLTPVASDQTKPLIDILVAEEAIKIISDIFLESAESTDSSVLYLKLRLAYALENIGSEELESNLEGDELARVKDVQQQVFEKYAFREGLFDAIDGEYAELARQIADRGNWNNERMRQEVHREESLVLETDESPVQIIWRRTNALFNHILNMDDVPDLTEEKKILEALSVRIDNESFREYGESAMIDFFRDIAVLRRRIAFSNPLLDFDDLVFIKRDRANYNHMCDQYFGIHAVPGGGLYRLEGVFGAFPREVDILEDSRVTGGRLEGEQLKGGAFLSPDICFDGERLLFSYVECRGDRSHQGGWVDHWDKGWAFHIFTVDIDGNGLEQLTDGASNDLHPCWLPDGRIVFISERRGGFGRCHGRPVPTYTLHRMNEKGEHIRPLSYFETNEWLPSIDHDGRIVYTRWDYVDRDSNAAHHIWLTSPDGRDARAPHGNWPLNRSKRPWMEMSIRAIPDSHKYLAVAAPHHGQNFGSLVTIDLRLEDDDEMNQVRRVTPEVQLPESEPAPGHGREPCYASHTGGEVYGTPWPLDEDFYLAIYAPGMVERRIGEREIIPHGDESNYGIYLVDAFGNKEFIYEDPEISCSDPIPLKSRTKPPALPDQTAYAKETGKDTQPETGTVSVSDVYNSRREWPEGTELKELRIIQIFPKTTPNADNPRIGVGDQSITRGVLGTVPIEDDGSAHFEVPAGVPFYFQALDERGMAVQNMATATYVHPGEHLSCHGCHEPVHQSPPPFEGRSMPKAFSRLPHSMEKEPEGSYPVSFSRLVQPVLDNNCVTCHEQNRDEGAPSLSGDSFGRHGWSEAYISLAPYGWWRSGSRDASTRGLRFNKKTFSIPGEIGAHNSELFDMLDSGHHDVDLTREELRRITLWLDANTLFFGDYLDTQKQQQGEKVTPRLE